MSNDNSGAQSDDDDGRIRPWPFMPTWCWNIIEWLFKLFKRS